MASKIDVPEFVVICFVLGEKNMIRINNNIICTPLNDAKRPQYRLHICYQV